MLRFLSAAVLVVTALSPAPVNAASFVGFRQHALDLTYPGVIGGAGFVSADLDNDGIEDLISANQSASDLVVVFGRRSSDGALRTKLVLPYAPRSVVAISAVPDSSDQSLVVIRNDGQADVYGNWPLEVVDTVVVPVNAVDGTVSDVDADLTPELVIATTDGVKVYDLQSHVEELDISVSALKGVAVAQLDGDASLEILANGIDKLQLFDGATGSPEGDSGEWVSFLFTVGNLGVGGAQQIAAAYGPDADVFGGSPFGFQWNWHSEWSSIQQIHSADIDGNGRDELLLGETTEDRVIVLDAATHLERLSFGFRRGGGFSGLTSLDIDGDGILDLIAPAVSPELDGYQGSILRTSNGESIYTWTTSLHGMATVALADVDDDGQVELLAGEGGESSWGRFLIVDAATGITEWGTDYPAPVEMSHSAISVGNADDDPNMEIALGSRWGDIVLLDGVTRQVDLAILRRYDDQIRSRGVGGLTLLDISSDGKADIVAATHASDSGSITARIQAFSAQDGSEIWSSTPIGSDDGAKTFALVQGQTDADPAIELIVFASDTIQAFDATSHAVDWTISINNNGGLFDPAGVSGPEIVAFSNAGNVSIYDALTRNFLRGFSLPGRLEGLQLLEPDGNLPRLLALSENKLMVVSGVDGAILFQSENLGDGLTISKPIASLSQGRQHWVASAREYGWRLHRLGNLGVLYANDFE